MNSLKCSECGSTSFVPSLSSNGTMACSFCGAESLVDSLPQMVDEAVKRHLGTPGNQNVSSSSSTTTTNTSTAASAVLNEDCSLFGNVVPCPNLDMTNREWNATIDEIHNLQRVLIGIRDREAAKQKGLMTPDRSHFEQLFHFFKDEKA